MILLWHTVALLQAFLTGASCLNILVVHPLYAGSHVLTLHTLSKHLIGKGHQVTTFKYTDDKLPNLDYRASHRVIERSFNNTDENFPFVTPGEKAQFRLPLEMIWSKGNNVLWTILQMVYADKVLMAEFCSQVLRPSLVEELLDQKFDVAVIDLMFNECGLALAHQLGVPSVGYWAFSFASGVQEYTSMGAPPSFVPAMMSRMSTKMNFIERTFNFALKSVERLYMAYHASIIDDLLADHLPTSPDSSQLLANLSGVLINTDYVLDYARPQPPSFINVGGLQINSDPGPLPQNMLQFMEGAEHGVILFTMGFIYDPTAVPRSSIQKLMSVFSRLPQRVIMKLASKEWAMAAPSNVLVVPWVPQQAVLAHPRTKIFITHCGMHGVLEAIHYSVPMVGMPVFIDQGDILTRMEEAGIAVGVTKEASSEDIHQAIREVRDNPVYSQNIQALSRVFQDKETHPMKQATNLVEFIGRTGGANHLKVQTGHLNLVQYYSMDSVLFLLMVSTLLLWMSWVVCSAASARWLGNSKSRLKKTN